MSLNDGFDYFYNEFKDWTKKQILHRTYDICLENADKDKEIEKSNNIINELETWINNIKTFDDICVYEDYSGRWGIQPKYILNKLKELKENNNE